MYTNENTIKLFDSNNNFVPDFDEKIDEIEKSIYGEHYYDENDITINKTYNEENKKEINEEIKVKKIEEKKKASFKDFIPVIFFMLLFAIIIYAGYYFLNTVDLTSLINK